MSTVTFSNGRVVNFDGTPTPQDIEEVSQKFGISQAGNSPQPSSSPSTPSSSPSTPSSPFQQSQQPQSSQDKGVIGNIQSGNYSGAAGDTLKGVGNFLFPIVGDVYHDFKGDSKKTFLQQAGDTALSILPFIPGLGEAGEALRGGKAVVEGAGAVADATKGGGLLSKALSGKGIVGGATTGYGMGVASNLSQGQGLGQAFTPNLNNIGGAVLGSATGGLVKGLGLGQGTLSDSATNDITKVLSPTTKVNKAITQKIAPELAQKGIVSSSREGLLAKYQNNAQQAGEALEQGYQQLPQDAKFEVTNLFKNLSNKINDMTVNGKVPSAAKDKVDALTKVTQDLANIGLTPSQDGSKVFSDVANVRKLRQIMDNSVKGSFSPTDLDTAAKQARLTLSNSIRQEFASQYPDIAKLNHDFSFWDKASGVLEDAINRKTGQSGLLRKGISGAIGAAGGLPSGHPIIGSMVMKSLSDFVNSPAWHTTSALVKSKLANMLGSGDVNGANKLLNGLTQSAPGLIGRVAQPLFNAVQGR